MRDIADYVTEVIVSVGEYSGQKEVDGHSRTAGKESDGPDLIELRARSMARWSLVCFFLPLVLAAICFAGFKFMIFPASLKQENMPGYGAAVWAGFTVLVLAVAACICATVGMVLSVKAVRISEWERGGFGLALNGCMLVCTFPWLLGALISVASIE